MNISSSAPKKVQTLSLSSFARGLNEGRNDGGYIEPKHELGLSRTQGVDVFETFSIRSAIFGNWSYSAIYDNIRVKVPYVNTPQLQSIRHAKNASRQVLPTATLKI
jgi:hypothetical protein